MLVLVYYCTYFTRTEEEQNTATEHSSSTESAAHEASVLKLAALSWICSVQDGKYVDVNFPLCLDCSHPSQLPAQVHMGRSQVPHQATAQGSR